MSERPTPETDAFILANAESEITNYQWVAYARRMENERDKAKGDRRDISKAINRLSILNNNLMAELIAARRERDNARELVDRLHIAFEGRCRATYEWYSTQGSDVRDAALEFLYPTYRP